MSTTSSLFDQIESTFQQSGTESALAQLANALSESKKYHELFEARKLQLRCELGLPLLSAESVDQLDEPVQNQLEDGLAKICREILSKKPQGDLSLLRQEIKWTESSVWYNGNVPNKVKVATGPRFCADFNSTTHNTESCWGPCTVCNKRGHRSADCRLKDSGAIAKRV